MAEVVMPRLSDSMEEGTILRWLKSQGDEVHRGDELVEIETDKATMTYEADQDGVLEIVADEGQTLSIGEVIARIGEGGGSDGKAGEEKEAEGGEDEESPSEPDEDRGEEPDTEPEEDRDEEEAPTAEADREAEEGTDEESPSEPAQPSKAAGDEVAEPEPPTRKSADTESPDGGERVKASPVARRMARDRDVDLGSLDGSGPGGRIVKADVEAAADGQAQPRRPQRAAEKTEGEQRASDKAQPEPATAKGEMEVRDLSRTQQLIARRMAESKATVPDFTLEAEIDMEAAVEARGQLEVVAGEGPVPTFNDMVIKACALALREFPRANGSYRDGRFELHSRINVGMAVAVEDALVVPTVFEADRKTLGEIARETRDLAGKVREGKISPPEVSGGTFTVSNLGMYGITNFSAIINPPQAAILSIGALEPKAVVHEGEVVARHRMAVTLGCDHRILYGAEAAEFLGRIRALLQRPAALAL